MNKEPKFTDTQKPLVAIHCMVYNHAPYLRECFEGFVMQQTSFPFVAIVHDDASTDNSAEIIREYEAKYPHIFKPIYQIENQHAKPGVSVVKIINNAIQQTGAKYIALCEGDDYWTDPLKLQRQVDFLEENPQYTFCCHRFKILKDSEKKFVHEYGYDLYIPKQNLDIDEEVFFKEWVTQWLTTVARTDLFIEVCDISKKSFNRCLDVYIYFLLLQQGNGISINEKMGIYRWHENGAAKGLHGYNRIYKGYQTYSKLLKEYPHDKLLQKRVKYYVIGCLGLLSILQINNRNFFSENIYLFSSSIQKIKALIAFIIPPRIWNFFRKRYRIYRLNTKLS